MFPTIVSNILSQVGLNDQSFMVDPQPYVYVPFPSWDDGNGAFGEVLANDAFNGTINAGDKNCLNDINWVNFVSNIECAADQVSLESVTAGPARTCVAGEQITITLNGDVKFASGKMNPSWYIGTDGGDSLSGICHASTLSDSSSYAFTNGGSINFDTDVCGDIVASGETTLTGLELANQLEVTCVDEDDDGQLDFSICFGWNEDAYYPYCDSTYPTIGDSFSSCDCSRHNAPGITVTKPHQPLVPPCS
jgi:hypothetical protein